MGLDVWLFDRLNNKKIPYKRDRYEPFYVMKSLIDYWEKQRRKIHDDIWKTYTHKEFDNLGNCDHPWSCFSKYGLNVELQEIWNNFLDPNSKIAAQTRYNNESYETNSIKVELW